MVFNKQETKKKILYLILSISKLPCVLMDTKFHNDLKIVSWKYSSKMKLKGIVAHVSRKIGKIL